jgi:hypothetical protein
MAMCAWAVRFEDRDGYSRIAATHVGSWWISTVWLGLDHGYGGQRRIFETMIFWHGPEGGEPDHDRPQARYATLQQARDGHARAVRELRRTGKHLEHALKDLDLSKSKPPPC